MSDSLEIELKGLKIQNPPMGDIIFQVESGEMMRVKANGDFLVKGNLVTNDMEVYEYLREWCGLPKREPK